MMQEIQGGISHGELSIQSTSTEQSKSLLIYALIDQMGNIQIAYGERERFDMIMKGWRPLINE